MPANVSFERIFTGRELTFNVQFQPDEESGWLVARVVELPGCVSQGATMAEARANIADALESYLEVMFETAISNQARQASSSENSVASETARISVRPTFEVRA